MGYGNNFNNIFYHLVHAFKWEVNVRNEEKGGNCINKSSRLKLIDRVRICNNTSVSKSRGKWRKKHFFQKLFSFINIVPLKSDTISPTSF